MHNLIELHRTDTALDGLRGTSYVDEPHYLSGETDAIFLAQHVRSAINWAWAYWHVHRDRQQILVTLRSAIRLAMQAREGPQYTRASLEDRGFVDQMLLAAALLSGDPDLPREIAVTVVGAHARPKPYQFFSALAGVIANSVLGDERKRLTQVARLKRYKATRIDAVPSMRLVDAFISGDDKALSKAIAAGVKPYWGDRSLPRNAKPYFGRKHVVHEDETRIALDLAVRSGRWMWPYIEATFARLAILAGRTIKYDDFWFPLPFVAGVDSPSAYKVVIIPEEKPKLAAKKPTGSRRSRKNLKGLLTALGIKAPAAKKKSGTRKPPKKKK